jgi:DNA polymerase III subunit delta'
MLERIAGNQHAKQVLKRMLVSGRVPGALLFAGEPGIGKKLFALEVAKAVNCRSPRQSEACDECPSCLRIAQLNNPDSTDGDEFLRIIWTNHPDVGLLLPPPGRFLRVGQMREVEREANFRPYEGRARFFLIDEADRFNDSSANALLKTLEEPPPTSHIILLTSRPATLLATVRSRCQLVQLAPLTAAEIETVLVARGISKADARLRSRIANGSLGQSLSQDPEGYRTQRQAMLEVLNAAVLTEDRSRLLRTSEQMAARQKGEYESLLVVLEVLIRDAWLLSLGMPRAAIVNDDLHRDLAEIAQTLEPARAAGWLDRIEDLRDQLLVNVNRKIVTDALVLGMAAA